MAYAVVVEAYRDLGTDLVSAIEKANASIGLSAAEPAPNDTGGEAPERVPTAAENDAALRELEKMMQGVR